MGTLPFDDDIRALLNRVFRSRPIFRRQPNVLCHRTVCASGILAADCLQLRVASSLPPIVISLNLVAYVTATCVGDLLYTGTGCLRDYGEALRYYLRAANAGEPASANALGLMYELGRGIPRDSEAAVAWYVRAANLG